MLSRQPPELTTHFLRGTGEPARADLLDAFETGLLEPIKRKLRYPEDTVGGLMAPVVSALPSDIKAAEALDRLQRLKLPVGCYPHHADRRGRILQLPRPRW